MSTGRWLLRAASIATALGLWQLLTSLDVDLWLRFAQFPTVGEVAAAFADRVTTAEYWQDLGYSLRRIAIGFLLAAVTGVATGTALARSRRAADLLGPLIEEARPVPAIALVPVAILLLPTNEQGIVFITFAAAFFPVVVSTRHAVRALSPVWEEAVLTMGGGRLRVLVSVVLPGTREGAGRMSTTTALPATEAAVGAELTLEKAELGHRGGPPVLGALDLRVAPGEVLTVVGPSGCGKSTLLRTLAGLLPPLGGEVTQDGGPIAEPGADRATPTRTCARRPSRPWLAHRAHPEARDALATATGDSDADVRAYAARATS
ncbi:ATP-binding cassette domain-containing protein [Streptomyces xanthochromogenes]|uniref:ATP-binding cassette domain-containing protein n=1 Tax=Streptomyces xanthochromogenes TaxID=67384 RepID=UPI002F423963